MALQVVRHGGPIPQMETRIFQASKCDFFLAGVRILYVQSFNLTHAYGRNAGLWLDHFLLSAQISGRLTAGGVGTHTRSGEVQ